MDSPMPWAGGGGAAATAVSRRPSMAGSMMTGPAGGRRLVPDFEFSLTAAKAKVLKSLEESVPPAFVRFFGSALFDRLLAALVLYFCCLFQQDLLRQWSERSRTAAHADGCNPAMMAVRVREVAEEVASRRGELSQPYCKVLLKHSSYKKQQADKRFFESLYAALTAVLHEAFDQLQRRPLVEQELGQLFRGKHFNASARIHGPQRSVDSLTVMQLWEVKNEAGNRALHSKLISSLFEKAPALAVQAASVANTPLVSQAVSSPMVARSLLADPVEREALLALPYSRSPKTKGGASKPAAGIPGTGTAADGAGGSSNSPRLAAAGSSTLHPSSSISSAACTVASTPAGARASTIGRPFQGVVAALPEAAGLPYDEQYTYLCLLRRSVLYGPTMGLPTAPQAAGGGRSSMISLTGAASGQPCMLSSSSSVVFRM